MIKAQGFTLIELMIVVAIIGILAVVAVPAYNDYTKKSRFAELLSIADAYKVAVAVCYADQNALTGCNHNTNGIPAAATATTNLAPGMTVTNGIILMTGNANTGGYTSELTPTVNTSGSGIVWAQSGTCLAVGYCRVN